MIKLVVFDIGGVIVHDLVPNVVSYLASYFRMPADVFTDHFRRFEQAFYLDEVSEREIWAHFTKLTRVPVTSPSLWVDAILEQGVVNRHVWDFVLTLRARDCRLGLLSNTESPMVQRMDELFDTSMFELRIYSCEIGLAKPDPRIYEHLIEVSGQDPAEILFFDDRQVNVDGARASGLRAYRLDQDSSVEFELLVGGS